ncbi:hypothetical protein FACS189434_00410 [Bacteroidia bacterium]|nr:hypothetical protein FACS189434_00410 [Bacteroidia bacterium]
MVYKFVILSDEEDLFSREISIDADSTFLDLHEAILKSVKYDNSQMTSFFLCNDDWEKEQEITLVEMDTAADYDSVTMDDAVLSDYLDEEGQKLLYVFDYLADRAFFIRLKTIETGKHLDKALVTKSEGNAPKQTVDFDEDFSKLAKNDNFDTDFYGDEEYDLDELDAEGFDFGESSEPFEEANF